MNGGKWRGWLGLALMLALGLGGCTKGPTEQVEVGYQGKAKSDPFLAAARYLEACGMSVKTHARYSRNHEDASTIVAPAQAFTNAREAKQVIYWANRGGHLIVFLQGGEYWLDDWRKWKRPRSANEPRSDKKKRGEKAKPDGEEEFDEDILPIVKELRAVVTPTASRQEKVRIKRQTFNAEMEDEFRLLHKPAGWPPAISVGTDDKLGLHSYKYGTGRITLVANAHPFRNRYIDQQDHAALLRAIVELESHSEVLFLHSIRPKGSDSLFQRDFLIKLWEEGWMALVTLAAVIAFWIWKNVTRFGPAYAPEDRSARSFTENLMLAGALLWRFRQTNALLEPMRRELEEALAKRGWSMADSGVVEEIAARTGLTPLRVQLACAGDLPTDGIGFQKLVQDLQLIRTKI